MNKPVQTIDSPSRLHQLVAELQASRVVAIDTESNSRHYYPEQLCLVQIATESKIFLVDTIKVNDLSPLRDFLSDPSKIKVIHDASYDILSFDRYQGLRLRGVFDTQIAARFLGFPGLSLESVIENALGKKFQKSERLQQSDWGKRPLSAEAVDYAANDVRFLIELKHVLENRLKALGRLGWVAEETERLEQTRYEAPDKETAFLYMKGARDLDGRGLAILKTLWKFREAEALRFHRPPAYVIPNESIVYLAYNPKAALSSVPGLHESKISRYGSGLLDAIRDGEKSPPVDIIRAERERPTPDELARLNKLKAWRISVGTKLNIDPSLVWPRVSLEEIARGEGGFDQLIRSDIIRNWQVENFGEELRRIVMNL